MQMPTQKEIDARNEQIAARLQETFGDAVLTKVKDTYARYDLDAISADLIKAREEGLVFDVSRGPEVPSFLTPDEVITRFAEKSSFRAGYELVTPKEAINKIATNMHDGHQHFTSLAQNLQEERAHIYAQDSDFLTRMRLNIEEYDENYKFARYKNGTYPTADMANG